VVLGWRIDGDARFAYDAYRRLIQMFATVVLGCPTNRLRSAGRLSSAGAAVERRDLTAGDLQAIAASFQA
jgi:pyruvate,orthophosphate dikinase